MRALRSDDRLAVADDRVRELREQERPAGAVAAAFRGMVAVVQPDADDLAGARMIGAGSQALERHALLGARRQPADGVARTRRRGDRPGRAAAADDDLVAVDPAGADGLLAVERDQAHRAPRLSSGSRTADGAEPTRSALAGADGARRSATRSGAHSAPRSSTAPPSSTALRSAACTAPPGSSARRRSRRSRGWPAGRASRAAGRGPRRGRRTARPCRSNRATTGPATGRPAAKPQTGLGGNGVEQRLQRPGLGRAGPSPEYRTTRPPCSRLWIHPAG